MPAAAATRKGVAGMREAEAALKRMALYYLLLAINIIPCASVIPDAFPIRTISEVYLLALTVCLILYYVHRVTQTGALSSSMKLLSWMALLLILLRGVKYSAFSEVGVLARHTWYLYYVPMLLIPLLLFYISLLVSPGEKRRISGVWRAALALTVVFIALVLTNDLHQLVFGFRPDYADWDSDYTHGWLFYALTVWQYALYFAGVVILVLKCRVGSAKRLAWIILFPFAIGMTMNVLLFTDRMPRLNGSHLVEFPEAMICTVAVVLECCVQLGLIPTNADYGRMFRLCSISAQITDQGGRAVYSSRSATPLTREQLALENGARIITPCWRSAIMRRWWRRSTARAVCSGATATWSIMLPCSSPRTTDCPAERAAPSNTPCGRASPWWISRSNKSLDRDGGQGSFVCYCAGNTDAAPSGTGLANDAIGKALSRAILPFALSTGRVNSTVAPVGTPLRLRYSRP